MNAIIPPPSNLLELTVTELSGALKRTIEDRFGLVRVRGEISNYRGPHSSGHAYFNLKDDSARIDAVVWKTTFARLKVKPQEGLEVIATGKVTTFPGKSSYQIVIESIEPAGIGALMALLEARRKALAAEGLFDAARKRALPFLPRSIGVVTSPTGAVIRDILHRIDDRFPRHVLVWPVRVQGETAASEIAAAIEGFNTLPSSGPIERPDVIIVARGGGSLEDLWAFNEDIVVRAAAASSIPLISAVGHETDTTLIDFVSDLRAPTPSGAAEKAVPVRADLLGNLSDVSRRHGAAMRRSLDRLRIDMRALARALPNAEAIVTTPWQRVDRAEARLVGGMGAMLDRRHLELSRIANRLSRQAPRTRLAQTQQILTSLEQRMTFYIARAKERRETQFSQIGLRLSNSRMALRRDLKRSQDRRDQGESGLVRYLHASLALRRDRLSRHAKLLHTLGYRQVLARGFALVRDGTGQPVRGVTAIPADGSLDIEFADGHIRVSADTGIRPVKTKRRQVKALQDSLF